MPAKLKVVKDRSLAFRKRTDSLCITSDVIIKTNNTMKRILTIYPSLTNTEVMCFDIDYRQSKSTQLFMHNEKVCHGVLFIASNSLSLAK